MFIVITGRLRVADFWSIHQNLVKTSMYFFKIIPGIHMHIISFGSSDLLNSVLMFMSKDSRRKSNCEIKFQISVSCMLSFHKTKQVALTES